ncbi:DUF4870 domain-containing protein [Curtobacterium flaccumfaciens]|jgi:uncharacterized Tic20 family protein|uniref:DUF4870 domain-containing protein n=1 Tax=Curtobacterium flaccumfaciens TaxID=2035 RepID=UPI001F4F5E67|nr:DUF4870 domain-containing protein [Curtobacterium flaccumfaciens]MCS0646522.1 DUF4870 domain-containing protein [Curtobacterium flaccumfaciens pv. flaccumfaciens]MCS6526103.1 DUF4870 domain-containing protein [Curtobacterium flaccumfaciens pv. flaccumfaciens]MCS6528542.1 DUF4870 domain-containing protein [Curtobacterium flaccumfaciens pv. flaccumfaciens]
MTYGQQPDGPGPEQPGGPYGHGPGGPQQPGGTQYPGGPQYPAGYTPPQPMSPEDQRLWATLTHIGGIFFTVVAPLVAYLVLRDRGGFIREHTRVALNFHITMAIAYFVGSLTSVFGIGVLIVLAAAIVSLIFSIMAAVAANQGQFYRYPLSIEFIKQ